MADQSPRPFPRLKAGNPPARQGAQRQHMVLLCRCVASLAPPFSRLDEKAPVVDPGLLVGWLFRRWSVLVLRSWSGDEPLFGREHEALVAGRPRTRPSAIGKKQNADWLAIEWWETSTRSSHSVIFAASSQPSTRPTAS